MLIPSGSLKDPVSLAFDFLDQLVFRLFMLFSTLLTAGLLLRPHWIALRGRRQKEASRKRGATKRVRPDSHHSASERKV